MTQAEMNRNVLAAGLLHGDGKLAEAEALYRSVLEADPGRTDAMCGLGLIASQTGRHEEALRLLRWDVVSKLPNPLLLVARSAALVGVGGAENIDAAVSCARRAVKLDPAFADAHNNLGCALQMQGKLAEASGAFRHAVQLRPAYPEALFNLGRTLYDAGDLAGAVGAYRAAVAVRPDYPGAYFNQGFALRRLRNFDEAARCFRQAVALQPGFSEAMHNLGVTLAELGQVAEAAEWHQKALAAKRDNVLAHSGLMYLLQFHPDYDSAAIAAEAARWDARFGAPLMPASPVYNQDRTAGRRLRVGYVSPDFYAHAQCRFTLPFFERHDHRQFEIHCYSSVRRPDAITARLRACADQWHDVGHLSDAALAEKIRADQIDVLVDLSMHMEDHRLLVFARRPAPVQITWLAYPTCPGVRAMDYRITDATLEPPELGDPGFPERPLYIPELNCCYHPVTETPEVAAPPVFSTGMFTFGSLNNFRKMSPGMLGLWADVLRAIPASRLIMLCPEGEHRRGVQEIFAQRGVDRLRVQFLTHLSGPDYLRKYNEIDVCLDPLPYNGITTTLDALWMGVPVLTLRGRTAPGRASAAILRCLQMPEWIAETAPEFVQKAAAAAADPSRLGALRSRLRSAMTASVVMDGAGFARKMEAAYRQAWQAWATAGA